MNRFLSTITLLTIFVYISSCNVNGSNNEKFTDHYSYKFQKNAALKIDTAQYLSSRDSTKAYIFLSVKEGNDVVFTYKHEVIAPDDYLDAGSTEKLIFQVSPDVDKFELTNQDFKSGNAFYSRSCFCENSGTPLSISSGTIHGEYISAMYWFVNADVTIDSSKHISFERPFYIF